MELVEAIKTKNISKIKVLMSSGVNIYYTDELCIGVIHHAVWQGLIDIVRELVESGISVNLVSLYNGWTPLFFATRTNNLEMIDTLISLGANPLIVDQMEETLIHSAAICTDSRELCKKLLSFGIPINSCNITNETPLHWAAYHGNLEFVKELVENGADIYSTDGSGWTPAKLATSDLRWDVVTYLNERERYLEQRCPNCQYIE